MAPRLLDRLIELKQEDFALYTFAQRLFATRYNRMLFELLDDARRQPSGARDVPTAAPAPSAAPPAPY